MTAPSVSSRRAFTLIELLVVISILAILMGLLFPAVTGALENAKKTQVRNDAMQIATAINNYYTEYGRFPVDEGESGNVNDPELWDVLSGKNPAKNPRAMVFLEIPKAKGGKNGRIDGEGNYKDAWGQDYEIRIDTNYDNELKGPSGTKKDDTVQKTVLVWSRGNPRKVKDYDDPSKWIKSYE